MMCPLLIELRASQFDHGLTMESFYRYFGITRQGFSKKLTKYLQEQNLKQELSKLIKDYRFTIDRRAGSRSLYYNLDIKEKYKIGVTKFEQCVSSLGLSLLPLRIKVVTTQSCHQSWNYSNLINGLIINDINQLVVGDITYISLGKLRYYLFCLTDVFSNRIVGHCLSKRMRSNEALITLKRCIKLRGKQNMAGCIHHTDGGGQYFAKVYLQILNPLKMTISVAQNCLENGYAEQKNGFIKNHLIPTMNLQNPSKIETEMVRAIRNYNHNRKQENLGWKSPVKFEHMLKQGDYNPKIRLHNHIENIASKRFGF